MSNLPVLRLSQALYTDVPTTRCNGDHLARQRRRLPSSSRKRALQPLSPTSARERPRAEADPQYSAVRVLLPRSFAVADCAYHHANAARTLKTPSDSSREKQQAAPCRPCRSDSQSSLEERDNEQQLQTSSPSSEIRYHDTHGAAAELLGADGSSVGGDDCGLAQPASVVTTEAVTHGWPHEEDVVVAASSAVVVESVLGFLAVRALLERAHDGGDEGVNTGTHGGRSTDAAYTSAVATAQRQNVSQTIERDSSGRAGVSKAVGRLVGWLRLAARTAALVTDNEDALTWLWPNDVDATAGGDDGSLPALYYPELAYSGVTERSDITGGQQNWWRGDEEGASVGQVGGGEGRGTEMGPLMEHVRKDGYHKVVGMCEAEAEWSIYYLELVDGTDEVGRPWIRQKISAGGAPEKRCVLEVKLMCHPLVTMAPDIRWCLRLIAQAKAIATLLNANAKLSTLGGGYFLTRQVGQAIHLARAQAQVATALGDLRLARKCRINEAYNYIWLGDYAKARTIIYAQLAEARGCHDEELKTIAAIAARFLTRARKANHRLLCSGKERVSDTAALRDGIGGGASCVPVRSTVNDGQWAPPRIDVKTDEWHRVRALPLYCSAGSV